MSKGKGKVKVKNTSKSKKRVFRNRGGKMMS